MFLSQKRTFDRSAQSLIMKPNATVSKDKFTISRNKVAVEESTTPDQVFLVWVLAQKPWIVPIPGTTKKHRLVENAGAGEITLTHGEFSKFEIFLHLTHLLKQQELEKVGKDFL